MPQTPEGAFEAKQNKLAHFFVAVEGCDNGSLIEILLPVTPQTPEGAFEAKQNERAHLFFAVEGCDATEA